MFKVIELIKIQPGLSQAEFTEWYEDFAAGVGDQLGPRGLIRHVQRHLVSFENGYRSNEGENPYDVITELWFETEAQAVDVFDDFRDPAFRAAIDDIERDYQVLSETRIYTVEEREADLGRGRTWD